MLTEAALAPSTRDTYKRAWNTFETFCNEVLSVVIRPPLTVTVVSLFIAYLFKKYFAPSTNSTYLSALAYVHKMLSLADPTQSFLVHKLINGTYRLSKSFDSRLPITITIINRILVCIPSVILTKYEQCLFRALFLFAFSAFVRIGELVMVRDGDTSKVIQLADVSFLSENNKIHEVNVCFKQFKHNIKGIPKTITFSHGEASMSAVTSLVNYLGIRQSSRGPLFLFQDGRPMSRSYFDKSLHKCLAFCGLDSSRYKGHSFRIGAASFAAEKGLSDAQIRSMGRWNSNAFRKYIRSNYTS